MTRHFSYLITTGIIVLGLGSSTAVAQRGGIEAPPVPLEIEVPSGHSVYLKGHAVGTQNYVCLPEGDKLKWKLMAPQATVFYTSRGGTPQQTMTHFLGAYPVGYGPAFPSWQHSADSSQVWGRKRDESDDPAYVEPGAIKWLLVEVVGAERGPAGGSALAETTFIHRLNTSGGIEPSPECTNLGALVLIPYTADYFFYREDRK